LKKQLLNKLSIHSRNNIVIASIIQRSIEVLQYLVKN